MKLLVIAVATFFNFLCYADANKLWNETDVDKLKKDLLDGYDPNTRPASSKEANSLHVSMTLLNVEMDETRGVLTTHAWVKMNWSDSKLHWNKESYGGISELRLSADEVWTPDLTVYNSAEHNIVDHFAKTNKIVYPNGNVLWVPTTKIETYCKMDLVYWPYDQQTCIIKMGSWTYSGFQLNLLIDSRKIDLSHYMENSEWEILKTQVERHEKYYPCCVEPYPDVTFEITFKRSSQMFKALVVTPVMVIVFMTLVSFWLPPQSGEKLLLNGIACIVICLLLMYFSQILTIQAASSPIIVTFYSHTLYMLGFSFIISVIVINISRNRKHYAVPRSIKANFMEGCIGKMLGGGAPTAGDNSEDQQETQLYQQHHHHQHTNSSDVQKITQSSLSLNPAVDDHQADWIRLAKVIDRATFVIYVFIFIIIGALHFI